MATQNKNLSDFSHMEVASASPYRFGIVVSQWNAEVTGPLLEGAFDALTTHGAHEHAIKIIQVPGSYELTSGADMLLRDTSLDAVICLGCVIQGETKHFDYICSAVAHGITHVALKHNKPVIFGVLTTDNLQQALDRAGGRHGNKGVEAAITAIQMAALSAT
ncbi:6,7-dimethyl-8-ribityllumazine synthase [Parapedobacter indicus]|uniref:6,7-dimethyl-8-ribityllumazine synthase n=1 Tax=Parapedobacter indicus TaxID=1477437 RepID=A0A1I3LT66_9SPHI|nr:6,7-dimethyl-8-ribityllumazine synthase [Parapedobacter indicus]PPL01388.1 6,7-dimethyl-8-ribityllumazine synthase [Parapedobacter indicus]SFI87939.1 6,7-dimethyl-8-ribityllumazine synthase [Parapedobacter indicus]